MRHCDNRCSRGCIKLAHQSLPPLGNLLGRGSCVAPIRQGQRRVGNAGDTIRRHRPRCRFQQGIAVDAGFGLDRHMVIGHRRWFRKSCRFGVGRFVLQRWALRLHHLHQPLTGGATKFLQQDVARAVNACAGRAQVKGRIRQIRSGDVGPGCRHIGQPGRYRGLCGPCQCRIQQWQVR